MSEIDNLKKYGASFQTKIIAGLLSDKSFLERIYDIVDVHYFESNAQQWIVGEIISYYIEYKTLPTLDVFKVKVFAIENEVLKASIVEQLRAVYTKISDSDLKYVNEQFLEFCKNQKLKQAIMDSVDLLKLGEYDIIKHKIDEAVKAGAERNLGHDYHNDIESRMKNVIRSCIKTDWEHIDKLMDGGLGAGELGIIVGAAGGGKSWALSRFGARAMLQGKNVLHFTLELNQDYVGRRYDSCFTGIDFQEIPKNYEKVKAFVDGVPGKLFIKYFPLKTVSSNSLKIQIERTQNIIGKKIDLAVIDYADILKPFASERNSNSYSEAGNIYEELRSVLGELQIPGWSASQGNRGAADQDIIQAHNVADSYRKIMTADFVMSLSRKINDKTNGTARFHVIKNRFGPDGMTFNARMNTSNGLIEMYDPESIEGIEIAKEMGNEEVDTKKLLKSRWDQMKSTTF